MPHTNSFSVITASYNNGQTIERCINSVRAQTHRAVQHIIVDNCSSDVTSEVLARYSEEIDNDQLLIIREPDNGIYDAWNKALDNVSNDWILFLGADDWLIDSRCLEIASKEITLDPGKCCFVSCRLVKGPVNGDLSCVEWESPYGWPNSHQIWSHVLPSMPPQPSLFHSKELFNGGRRFGTRYPVSSDKQFFFENIFRSDIQYLDLVLTYFSLGGRTNRNGNRLVRWVERNQLRRNLGIPLLRTGVFRVFFGAVIRDFIFRVRSLVKSK